MGGFVSDVNLRSSVNNMRNSEVLKIKSEKSVGYKKWNYASNILNNCDLLACDAM